MIVSFPTSLQKCEIEILASSQTERHANTQRDSQHNGQETDRQEVSEVMDDTVCRTAPATLVC